MFLSAKLKIERAYQHIYDVEQWLTAFNDFNPYRLAMHFDQQTGRHSFSITAPEHIYPHRNISTIVGDAAHNLRSALDHIASEIMSGSGEDPESIYFPMDDNRESFVKQPRYRKIQRFAPDFALLLADVIQPYKATNYGFWGLNRLDRADKHRSLSIILAVGTGVIHCVENEYDLPPLPRGTWVVCPGGIPPVRGTPADLHNQQNGYAPVDICFGEGEPFENQPVIPTLHQLAQLVGSVVQAFQAHMQGSDNG